MGPAYFVIAILGCADGSQGCTPVATMPVRYADRQSCSASVGKALAANTDLDFPTLIAECQAVERRPAATHDSKPDLVTAGAKRG